MLVLHALATVATVAAVLLGLWQYGAWQHGREHQAEARVDDAPVPLASVMTADQAFPAEGLGRPVSLSGRWVSSGTVYVTGKVLHGREGVWVVTPVEVCPAPDGPAGCDRAPAMLVVRGWAPSVERAPRPPSGPVEVTGWLQPGEGPGAGTGPAGQPACRSSDDPGDDVLGGLRIAEAVQHVDQDLYGGYVIAKRVSTRSTNGEGSTNGAGEGSGVAGLRRCRRPPRSRRCATCSTPSSGGSSAASRCSCGGAGAATR